MCGIVGIISGHKNGFSSPEVDAFTRMLFLDTLRGWDSTGVFGADNYGNVQIMKEASAGPSFITSEQYKQFQTNLIRSGKFVVGHNRAATRGDVNDQNAHPFWIDTEKQKLVLVQNGTWFGDHKHIKNTEVDTEALLHIIAEHENIQEAINKISAAYALVWFDVLKHELNFLRNGQRPMWMSITKSGAILFASEKETIEYAASKSDWKFEKPPYLTKEDSLWTVKFKSSGDWEATEKEVKKIYTTGGAAGGAPFRRQASSTEEKASGGHKRWFTKSQQEVAILDQFRAKRDVTSPAGQWRYPFIEAVRPRKEDLIVETDEEQRNRIMEVGFQYFKETTQVLVDVFDYFPANDNPECTLWHFAGELLLPQDHPDLKKVICYWTIGGMIEHAALQYSGKIYSATFGHMHCTRVKEGWFICARCTNPREIMFSS